MAKKFVKPFGVEAFINNSSNSGNVEAYQSIDSNTDSNTSININTDSHINTNIDLIKEALKYNKRAMRKKVMNLRLNDYYATALKALSKPEEGISMQDVMYNIISSGLDKKIDEILKSS
jgi:hypothetical protein